MTQNNIITIIRSLSVLMTYFLLTSCNQTKNLETLKYEPNITTDSWCALQDCMTIGGMTISQPSSSVIVYFLAALTLFVAFRFYQYHSSKSHFWWSISLILGGLGAFLAGTSFQAFGYEIKCVGKIDCSFTSWWEIGYNILTVGGAAALLVAISYSCMGQTGRKWSKILALLTTVIYTVVVLIGAFTPDKFMVSFELMLLFTLPAYLFIMLLNLKQYFQNKSVLLRHLLFTWILLFAVIGAYYYYLSAGFTQDLWQHGIWFSENDVLHVGMIGWLLFLLWKPIHSIADKPI